MRHQDGWVKALKKPARLSALIMQEGIPILEFAKTPSIVFVRGGTDASFAPPMDNITNVTAFYYEKFGIHFSAKTLQR